MTKILSQCYIRTLCPRGPARTDGSEIVVSVLTLSSNLTHFDPLAELGLLD